jgi:hypothetical protein
VILAPLARPSSPTKSLPLFQVPHFLFFLDWELLIVVAIAGAIQAIITICWMAIATPRPVIIARSGVTYLICDASNPSLTPVFYGITLGNKSPPLFRLPAAWLCLPCRMVASATFSPIPANAWRGAFTQDAWLKIDKPAELGFSRFSVHFSGFFFFSPW